MNVGNEQFRPASVADIRSPYQLTVGVLTLDLSQLHQPDGTSVTTRLDVGTGTVLVRVPRNVHVQAHCSAEVGSVNCLNRQANGPGATAQATVDASAGGTGGNIVLDVHVGSGTVEVTRG
jgi:predicted membrane protein